MSFIRDMFRYGQSIAAENVQHWKTCWNSCTKKISHYESCWTMEPHSGNASDFNLVRFFSMQNSFVKTEAFEPEWLITVDMMQNVGNQAFELGIEHLIEITFQTSKPSAFIFIQLIWSRSINSQK